MKRNWGHGLSGPWSVVIQGILPRRGAVLESARFAVCVQAAIWGDVLLWAPSTTLSSRIRPMVSTLWVGSVVSTVSIREEKRANNARHVAYVGGVRAIF